MLKFRGDEAVVWIDRVVLSPGQVGLVASLVQGQLDLSLLLGCLGCLGCPRGDRIHGGLYAKRFEQPQDFGGDSLVDAQTAKGDAAIAPMVKVGAPAVIATGFARFATIGDM